MTRNKIYFIMTMSVICYLPVALQATLSPYTIALFKYLQAGDFSTARAQLTQPVDVNAANPVDKGATPLIYAIQHNGPVFTQLLINKGANVNQADYNGMTPLHWAVFLNSIRLTLVLIKNNALINAHDRRGYTPLMLAAHHGNRELVQILLLNKADVNAVDFKRETVLHQLAANTHTYAPGIANDVIKAGALLNSKNYWGQTPRDIAHLHGYLSMFSLLSYPDERYLKGRTTI